MATLQAPTAQAPLKLGTPEAAQLTPTLPMRVCAPPRHSCWPRRPLADMLWLVTRYADVAAVLKDPRFSETSVKPRPRQPAARAGMPRCFPPCCSDSRCSPTTPTTRACAPGAPGLHAAPHRDPGRVRIDSMWPSCWQSRAQAHGGPDGRLRPAAAADGHLRDDGRAPSATGRSFTTGSRGFLEGAAGGLLPLLAGLPNGFRLLRFFERLIRSAAPTRRTT